MLSSYLVFRLGFGFISTRCGIKRRTVNYEIRRALVGTVDWVMMCLVKALKESFLDLIRERSALSPEDVGIVLPLCL